MFLFNKMGKRFCNRFSRIFNCKHGGGLVDKLSIHYCLKPIFRDIIFVDRIQSYRNGWNTVIKG